MSNKFFFLSQRTSSIMDQDVYHSSVVKQGSVTLFRSFLDFISDTLKSYKLFMSLKSLGWGTVIDNTPVPQPSDGVRPANGPLPTTQSSSSEYYRYSPIRLRTSHRTIKPLLLQYRWTPSVVLRRDSVRNRPHVVVLSSWLIFVSANERRVLILSYL